MSTSTVARVARHRGAPAWTVTPPRARNRGGASTRVGGPLPEHARGIKSTTDLLQEFMPADVIARNMARTIGVGSNV